MKNAKIGTTADGQLISIDLLKLVDTRLLVQANSGGGKSGTLRLIAERASSAIQTIILDNEGEFATLREKVDMLLVGDGGELPADPRSAKLLARRLLETQVSAVVDLYDLELDRRREFVKIFLESLIALPRTLWRPTLIMLDEAHLYAPQGGDVDSTKAVIALMAQGRKRGFCGILATQRLSKLHKDAAAECNNVLIGRTWLDVDQKRAGDVLGMTATDRGELRDLRTREFFGFGPAFSVAGVFRMNTDDVATTMPTAGHRDVAVPPPSSKVRALLAAELANLPETAKAEADEVVTLRRENARLRRESEVRQTPTPVATEAVKATAEREAKRAVRAEWEPLLKERDATIRDMHARLVRIGKAAEAIGSELGKEMPKLSTSPIAEVAAPPRRAEMPVRNRVVAARATVDSTEVALPKGERATLIAVAQYGDGATREQLTVLTGYKRSSRDAYLQRLREKGFVEHSGDRLMATDAGIEALGDDYEPLPTGSALRDYWLQRLPEGERRILGALIDNYPDAVDRSLIDDVTGYKRSSRDAYLQRLGVKRLVSNERGAVRASALLFD